MPLIESAFSLCKNQEALDLEKGSEELTKRQCSHICPTEQSLLIDVGCELPTEASDVSILYFSDNVTEVYID